MIFLASVFYHVKGKAVFGSAGDFVKAHNLQERDILSLYRDAEGSYVSEHCLLVTVWLYACRSELP